MDLDILITAADPARHAPLPGPDSPEASRLYQDIARGLPPGRGAARRHAGRAAGRPGRRPYRHWDPAWPPRGLARPAVVAVTVAAVAAGAIIATQATAPSAGHPGPGQPGSATAGPGAATPPPGLLLTAAMAAQPTARAAAAGMPRRYVTLDHLHPVARIRSSETGSVLAVVPLPHWADPKLSQITAGPGNHTFVLALTSPQATKFYQLRVTAGGHGARLAPLPIPSLPASQAVDAIALSPDGRSLAVAIQPPGPIPVGAPGVVEVVQLVSGAVRTWSSSGPGTPWHLSWAADGHSLAFSWDDSGPASGSSRTSLSGLWLLDTTAPGSGLLSGHRITPSSVGGDDIQSAVLSPDGRTMIASVTYDGTSHIGRGTVVGGIVALSARTGRPLRTLHTEHAVHLTESGGWAIVSCDLIAADHSGQHLLVSCDGFGRLDRGRFTPLPGSPAHTLLAAAW
ncbi:MAG: hypothetical protein ABJB47_04150 [Actinomycetota bacterium]